MAKTARRTGQLTSRAAGSWQIRVFKGRDENGKRQYYNETVKGNKRKAQKRLNKVLADMDAGTFVEPTGQTLREYIKEWLQSAVRGRVRPRTLRDYTQLLETRVLPELGDMKLSDIGPAPIQKLYTDMQERGLSARSVQYTHTVLSNALKQAVRWRKLAINPCTLVSVPRPQRREMQAFSPEQAQQFLQAVESDPLNALWRVLLTGGLRPGEACALRWSDLDGDRVRIQRTLVWRAPDGPRFEEPKTARSRRSVPLPPSTVKALAEHRRQQAAHRLRTGRKYKDQGLIFSTNIGTPLDLSRISRRFRAICKAADLPPIRLYDLRHTCATLLLSAGENPKVVSERLGHATITLTMDVYSHVLPDMQQSAADRMERILNGGGAA